ncbi:RNA polymerase sigma-70 factor [Reichenbachiella sp. MALMAid0571]|uniref:RNA polymerase sigma factor n=1 Tax=Reichenbachiella sp. MALMAid0571 TaxID=3143939 RepID=UPI0032DEDEEC
MIPKKTNTSESPSNYNTLTDIELMRLLQNGEEAFLEVYKRYWDKLYIYAHNLLDDKQICEDVIQDVFVDFWAKKDKVLISNLSHYLYQSVKFKIFNVFRNGKIAKKHIDRINVIKFVNNTEESLNFKELEHSLHNLLSQLPDRCREIFYASRYENLSHQEISKKFNITNQTVKNQVSKALRHLRDSFDSISILCFALFF